MQFYIEKLPLIVYGIALFLWIPILFMVWLKPQNIGRITTIAIISSMLALIYESYMTFVWSPTVIAPIRVDIFFILLVLGIVDGIFAYSLLSKGVAWKSNLIRQSGVIALAVLSLSVTIMPFALFIGIMISANKYIK
jgi:hypothetical protein